MPVGTKVAAAAKAAAKAARRPPANGETALKKLKAGSLRIDGTSPQRVLTDEVFIFVFRSLSKP